MKDHPSQALVEGWVAFPMCLRQVFPCRYWWRPSELPTQGFLRKVSIFSIYGSLLMCMYFLNLDDRTRVSWKHRKGIFRQVDIENVQLSVCTGFWKEVMLLWDPRHPWAQVTVHVWYYQAVWRMSAKALLEKENPFTFTVVGFHENLRVA